MCSKPLSSTAISLLYDATAVLMNLVRLVANWPPLGDCRGI